MILRHPPIQAEKVNQYSNKVEGVFTYDIFRNRIQIHRVTNIDKPGVDRQQFSQTSSPIYGILGELPLGV